MAEFVGFLPYSRGDIRDSWEPRWLQNAWKLVLGFYLLLPQLVVIRGNIPDTRYEPPQYTPGPDFLPNPSNVTIHTGGLAVLRCSVLNLGTKTVVWRRIDSSFPLTSGVITVVADDRIQISHVDYKKQWDLLIKNVQPDDEGAYECQVSSRDKSYRKLVYLTVIDQDVEIPDIQITGQQYIERGEPIDLQCNATGEYYPPDEMDWFRNGHRLSSNEPDGIKITKQYSLARRTFTSNLNIARAKMNDGGTYVCRSSNMQIASTKVHVLNAETFNIKRDGETEDGGVKVNIEEQNQQRLADSIHSSARAVYNHLFELWTLLVLWFTLLSLKYTAIL